MTTYSKQDWYALVGILLDIPALIIVALGVSQVLFGETEIHKMIYSFLTPQNLIIHPVLVLGGMLIAVGLNAAPVFRVQLAPHNGSLVTTIITEWKSLNTAVLALSLFLLTNILLYAFVENFRIVAR